MPTFASINRLKNCSRGLLTATGALASVQADLADSGALSSILGKYGSKGDAEESTGSGKNQRAAAVVQDISDAYGWLVGWESLMIVAPPFATHPRLIADIATCSEVYPRIRSRRKPRVGLDIGMKIVREPEAVSLHEIGPKSLGGPAWKSNAEYAEVAGAWLSRGFDVLPPFIAFGWTGQLQKVIARSDLDDVVAMLLLGTVDYNFDIDGLNDTGFSHVLSASAACLGGSNECTRGAAVAALMGFDLQVFVRQFQVEWAKEKKEGWNFGPADITPEDWVAATSADCAILAAFGYQSEADYDYNRGVMFMSMVMANAYDVLYDLGCSNRMSSIIYADAAGAARHNMHIALVATMMDDIAGKLRDWNGKSTILYGDSAATVSAPWSPYNGRYRSWERFVKYRRLLSRSEEPEATRILEMARNVQVLKGCNSNSSMEEVWRKVMTKGAHGDLIERSVEEYTPSSAPEVMEAPGVELPNLCSECSEGFREAVFERLGKIRAIEGLPTSITQCRAVGVATAIRQASLWAGEDGCCDSCASKVGHWADSVSYLVLVALMTSEGNTGPEEWLLQCYTVWSVSVWPLSVATILSGFDLGCNLWIDEGAMGDRDVVDC